MAVSVDHNSTMSDLRDFIKENKLKITTSGPGRTKDKILAEIKAITTNEVFLVTLTIQVLVSLGNIFEAGTDFGQIGPAVSATVTAAAASLQQIITKYKYETGRLVGSTL